MAWQRAAKVADLPDDRGWPVRVDGRSIAVFAVGDEVYAFGNECLHLAYPIDDALVARGCLICPWHGWMYDLVSGDQLLSPGRRPGLQTYPARIVGDDVLVDLPDA